MIELAVGIWQPFSLFDPYVDKDDGYLYCGHSEFTTHILSPPHFRVAQTGTPTLKFPAGHSNRLSGIMKFSQILLY